MKYVPHKLETADGVFHFHGSLLGEASSQGDTHNHPDTDYVQRGTDAAGRKLKCAACRWHEIDVYRTDDGRYVLHTIGETIIPGEKVFEKVYFTPSAYELIELATVRANPPYLPRTSAQALAQAAALDAGIRDAYLNRAVV
jgi:hypothetical protein